MKKTHPPPSFNLSHAEGARLGELTLFFFFCKIVSLQNYVFSLYWCLFILIPRIKNKLGIFNYDFRKIDE